MVIDDVALEWMTELEAKLAAQLEYAQRREVYHVLHYGIGTRVWGCVGCWPPTGDPWGNFWTTINVALECCPHCGRARWAHCPWIGREV